MSQPEVPRRIRVVQWFVAKLFPARAKRAMALVSLYALLKDEAPSMTQLTALNNTLRFGGVSGLQLPARIPNEIWGHGTQLRQIRDIAERETMILSRFPGWLTYGKQIDISADVKAVVQFVEARRMSVAMVPTAKEAVKIVQAV